MKKLLFAFLLTSVGASAQMKTICTAPACPVTYKSTDTAKVYIQVVTSDGYGSTVWKQTAGPTVAIPKDSVIWITSLEGYDGFYLIGLAAGSYSFQATTTSSSGSVAITTVTFTVSAPVPACPVIPSGTSRITGWIVVQSGGVGRIQVTYWDGTTALLP